MFSPLKLMFAAIFLIITTVSAHPIFQRKISRSLKPVRYIPNDLVYHGMNLPNIVRQSFRMLEACTSQSDCNPGQQCLLDPTTDCKSGFCTGCATTADCPSGQICFDQQPGDNFCVSEDIACSASTDCNEDQLCSKENSNPLGFCVQKGFFCESDDDCTTPETCILPPADGGVGICQQKCTAESDCEAGQTCVASTCVTPSCTSDADCDDDHSCSSGVCIPSTPVTTQGGDPCGSEDDCDLGYVCDSPNKQGDRFCVIPTACDSLTKPTPAATSTDDMPTPTTTAEPSDAALAPSTAPLPTETSAESTTESSLPPTADSTPKSSLQPSPQSTPSSQSSLSPSTESTPDSSPPADADSSSDVCVDARALSDFKTDELIFEKHEMAWVLCDANDSCATAGHMVMFKGKAMMMSMYCDMMVCKKKSMRVNSPRYKRGLRVQSKTDGLQYTVFAAKHETRMEESVLRVAVQAGL